MHDGSTAVMKRNGDSDLDRRSVLTHVYLLRKLEP